MNAAISTRSLWRYPAFNTFWAGQTLSALGDAFAVIATPLLVLQSTGSLKHMGMLTAAVAVSCVVAGLFAGSIVDSVDRRRLMIGCDLARWLIWSLVPLVWMLHGPNYPLLVLASCLATLLGYTFQVAAITAVANLVPRAQLIDANGRMHGSYAAMFFVGPMLAGLLCERFGPVVALFVDSSTFLASALSLLWVRAPFSRSAPRSSQGALRELMAGLRFLWANPTLRVTMVLLGLSSMLMAGRENMLIYHIKHDLRQGDRVVGMVFAVAALGAVMGAVFTSRMRARWGFAVCWLASGALLGSAVVGLGAIDRILSISLFGAVVGFAETVRGINTMTLRQEVTPDHLLGRVTAAFWLVLTAPAALGAAWTTSLAEGLGVRPTLALLGLCVVLLMLVGTRTSINRPVSSKA